MTHSQLNSLRNVIENIKILCQLCGARKAFVSASKLQDRTSVI